MPNTAHTTHRLPAEDVTAAKVLLAESPADDANHADAKAKDVQFLLLRWYDAHKRDLPWRDCCEPYAVWVTEIMAQQTQIAALLPYYERFMRRFPTVFDLANAEEKDVLKAWEGLGYYTRARNLLVAAQTIVSDWGGNIPNTKKELLSLPGIGDYTAGAIMSIAHGLPEPAVDGNVLRVFARLTDYGEDILQPVAKTCAKQFVAAAMPADRPGCFTQALMELGALVCTPKSPTCAACPLAALCLANKHGRQSALPIRQAKAAKKIIPQTVLVIQTPSGQVLMRRRSEKLLHNLWTFYMAEGHLSEAETRAQLAAIGYTASSIQPMGAAKHVFTHLLWDMRGYFCQVGEEFAPQGYACVTQAELKKLALPSAMRAYDCFRVNLHSEEDGPVK